MIIDYNTHYQLLVARQFNRFCAPIAIKLSGNLVIAQCIYIDLFSCGHIVLGPDETSANSLPMVDRLCRIQCARIELNTHHMLQFYESAHT